MDGLPDLEVQNVLLWVNLLLVLWCLGFDPGPLLA